MTSTWSSPAADTAVTGGGLESGGLHRDVQVGRLQHVERGGDQIGLDERTIAQSVAADRRRTRLEREASLPREPKGCIL